MQKFPKNPHVSQFYANFPIPERTRVSATRDEFLDGLQHFDTEGTGRIKLAELRHILTTLGERLSAEECDQLLQGLGDEQGTLAIDDFVQLITQ